MIEGKRQERKITRLFKSYYLLYTIVFLCFFLVSFAAFLLNKKSLVWRTDGMLQHYPTIVYLRTWVKELLNNIFVQHKMDIPMWDMTIGEGSSVLNTINFRPLAWLSLLVPRKYLEQYWWFRTAFSMYLSGITFSCFCAKFKKLDYSCLLGSIVYVFSGFLLCYASKHAFFIEFTIYFPLILLGTEKILNKESARVFIISVALAGASYFYMLFMLTVFAVIYAFIRYCYIYTLKNVRQFFKTIGIFFLRYVIGLGLAAVSFLPNLMMALSSGRVGAGEGRSLNLLFYSAKYYLDLFTSFMSTNSVGNYGYFMLSGLVFILIIELFFSETAKGTREKQLKVMVCIGCLFSVFPLLAEMINGFAGLTNRWVFAVSFGAGILVAFTLEQYIEPPSWRRLNNRSGIVIAIYVLFCSMLNVLYQDRENYVAFVLVYLCLFLVLWNSKPVKHFVFKFEIAILLVLLVEVGVKSYQYFAIDSGGLISQFLDAGKVEEDVQNVAAKAAKGLEDDSVYRVDSVEANPNAPYTDRNYGLRIGINGISVYESYCPTSIVDMVDKLGISQIHQNFAITSYDQRTVIDTLSAVKYVAVPNGRTSCVPYGYEFVTEEDAISIYKNKYALPLLYGYESSITEEEYDTLSINQREQAMLQGAVFDNASIKECDLQFSDYLVLDREMICDQLSGQLAGNFTLEEDGISCVTAGKSLTLKLPHEVTGEVYVIFEGLEYESPAESKTQYDSGSIRAEFGKTQKMGYALGTAHQYYTGPKDMLLNLGYVSESAEDIRLIFRVPGKYVFSDVRVVVQPMTDYSGYVQNLRVPIHYLTVDGDHIYAGFTLDKPRIVCVAVPYENGWRATINGVQTEIQRVNGRYIGFELPAGEYKIVLRYRIPGLFAGAAISATTLLLVAVVYIVRKVRIQKSSYLVNDRERRSDGEHFYEEK